MIAKILIGITFLLSFSICLQAQVVTKSNQIGINLLDPAANVSLHIKDDFEAIRLDGSAPFISFYTGTDYRGYLYMIGDNMSLYNRKAGNLNFGTSNSARMTINSLGDVGIGTISPETKLHVAEGVLTGGAFNGNTIAGFEKSSGNGYLSILINSASESGVLFGNETGSAKGGIIYNNGSATNGLQFRTNNNNTRMTIDDVGDVGIGISSPGRPLDLKSRNGGDEYGIRMERSGSATTWEMSLFQGNFNFFYNNGVTPVATISTTGTYSSSDRRLKKNIQPYKKVLPLLDALNISTYEFISDQEKATPSLGLIAQDVAKVYPEIVRLAPNRNGEMYYAIDYSKTGVLALKAIQELREDLDEKNVENKDLQAKVKVLESQNLELQERLTAIEAAIGRFEESCCLSTQRILLEQADYITKSQPYLYQNEPNPFGETTNIRYFIPEEVQKATLRIVTLDGKLIKQVPVAAKGAGQITLETHTLSTGTYIYTLIIDGEIYESRQMVLGRK